MRRVGLVKSIRGCVGGYQLAREPKELSVGEILEAVGESVANLPYNDESAVQAEDWVTSSLWRRLNQKLKQALYSITLADLYYDARSWQASQGSEANFIV